MSRVSQNELKSSPAKRFLTWKTLKKDIVVDGETITKIDKGTFTYYDKETEKNIPIFLPFRFALINADGTTFKGYDEKKKIGYYSNEVNDPEHEVIIRSKEGAALKFKLKDYKANKDTLSGMGIKYTKPCYVAIQKEEDEFELQCLVLSGAPLTGAVDMKVKNPDEAQDGWFSFTKVNSKKLYTNWIEVTGFKLKKKGETKFSIPIYKIGEEISKEEGQALDDLDAEFSEYLKYYFSKKDIVEKKETSEEVHDNIPTDTEDETDY